MTDDAMWDAERQAAWRRWDREQARSRRRVTVVTGILAAVLGSAVTLIVLYLHP
jgi:hypothetical protein